MSNPNKPWRPPVGSNNTTNKCWLNAPLYALLSNKYIREKIDNFKTSEGVDADVFDILYVKRNKVIEELRKFIDDKTVWNQASYKAFLKNTQQLGDVNITEIQIGANGGFDDAKNILDRLISFINDFVLIDVNDNKLKATKHTGIYPKYTDKLISVVSSTACMSLNQTGASHFFSYVKNNTKWFKVDADIRGFEPIELEYKDILASFSGNIHNTAYPVCEYNKSRAMYLIELVEPSELSKVESCNYKDGSAINQRDIIKKKGEEQQYFVTYAGKKEDEFGNTICPKITVMQVNTQSDFDLAYRIAQDKNVDRQFIEDNNSKLMDINSADFNEYEKQTSGFTEQSVAPVASSPPSSPVAAASSSSSSSKPASSIPPVASIPQPVAVPPPRAVASKPLSIIEIMKELVSEPAPPPLPVAEAADPLSIIEIMKELVSEPANGATTGATTTGATLTNEEVVEIIKQLNEVFSKVLGTGTGDGDGDDDDDDDDDEDEDEEEEEEDEMDQEGAEEGEADIVGEEEEEKEEEVQGEPNEVKVQILDQMVDGNNDVTSEVVNEHTIKVPPI